MTPLPTRRPAEGASRATRAPEAAAAPGDSLHDGAVPHAIPRWWRYANLFAASAAMTIILGRLLVNHDTNRGWWGYSLGEWSINYAGGFIRRGLGGEIIRHLPAPSDLIAAEVWVGALGVGVCALFAVLVHRAMSAAGTAWPLALWLLPSGFVVGPLQSLWQPFWVTATQFAMRKEQFLMLVVLVAAVWWSGRTLGTRSFLISCSLLGALLFAGTLMHEGVTVPATAAILLMAARVSSSFPGRLRAAGAAIIAIPVLLGISLAITHPGAVADRAPVWSAMDASVRSWYTTSNPAEYSPMHESGVPAAISYLGSDRWEGWHTVREVYFGTTIWGWWIVTFLAVAGAAALILLLTDPSRRGIKSLAVSALAVGLASAPLFPIAYDWGRWIVLGVNLVVITALTRIAGADNVHPVAPRPAVVASVATVLLLGAVIGVQEMGDPRGFLFPPGSAG